MQTQLLEDYERECEEEKKISDNEEIQKDPADDLESADKETDTVIDKDIISSKNSTDRKSDGIATDLLEELRVDLTKTPESTSKPSPSSTGKLMFAVHVVHN